jgi:methylglutaconyl-CoA hydratase
MSEFILVARQNNIGTITLNRPDKRNAMNERMIQEILHTLVQMRDDNDVRVVILRGEGEHFCAGADIHWMQQIAAKPHGKNEIDALMLSDLMYQLYAFPKPTIVLANGATMGGGLGLLAACDIAIGAENASFGFSEVKIGITPSIISPYIIAAIGERMAHYYFLTGERFNALEAKRIGLLHHVVDDDALFRKGQSIAETLLQNSPHALTSVKQLIRYVVKDHISPGLAQKTAEHLANIRVTKEAQEGLQAFMEKRSPRWE